MGVPPEDSVRAHFLELLPERSELLERIESDAKARGIPIVGPGVGSLLKLLALTSLSQKILELGTATGYSTIWLAQAADALQGMVHTYERDPELAKEAKKNIKEAGFEKRVAVRVEDAKDALPAMNDSFNLIFLDIEKTDYLPLLPDLVDILKPRGLLIADNAAFEEVRTFNEKLARTDGFDTVFLHGYFPGHSPERDGLAVARKRVA
jgi:caffeoyl-CoA O-methyltransferase